MKKTLLKNFLEKKRNSLLNPTIISNVSKTIEENLKCSICFELIIDPKLLLCGHIYCLYCIESSLIINKKCPLCRKLIKNYELHDNEIINKSIKYILKNKNKEYKLSYEKRFNELSKYKNKRIVKKIKINQELDIYHKTHGWVKGVVIDKYLSNEKYIYLKIRIIDFNDIILVNQNSLKISNKNYFSKKAKENLLENLTNNNIIIEVLDDTPIDNIILNQILNNVRNSFN